MHDDPIQPGPGRSFSVLIVEDEFLIAMDLEMILKENGHTIAGSAGTVEAAIRMLGSKRPDVAVLDVHLRGHLVLPVAERLRSLHIPFVLTTACTALEIEGIEVLKDAENVGKPTNEHRLMEALDRAVRRA